MFRILLQFIVFIGFFSSAYAQELSPTATGQEAVYATAGRYGMVVAQHHIGAEVGAEILARGGNAVDAAVATGFALAVVLPRSGNIGGGGFMLVYLAGEQKTIAIDYRETAPAAASGNMFLDRQGNVDQQLSTKSRASAGVPGTVAGLYYAHRKYGLLPWADLLAPAIRLAEEGFPVSDYLAQLLRSRKDRLGVTRAGLEIFYKPGGGFYAPGEILRQQDLAKTLKRIAENGPDGFYRGPVADLIVAEMARGHGLISHADLENYTVTEAPAVTGSYRGFEVVSMPPPSSGGVHIIQMLNVLENFDLRQTGPGSAATIQVMAETMKYAYADRSQHMGDPAFHEVPLAWLTDKEYARQIAGKIKRGGVVPSSQIKPGTPPAPESPETNHYSIVDKYGNAVSTSTTLNLTFGSGIVVAGAGFLLNNEMDDFSAKPGVPNAYGLTGGAANAIEPGKRPLSSMSPAIVLKDGKPVFITGSPGGGRILTAVLQSIVNFIDFENSVGPAVQSPRIHHQWLPDVLFLEPGFSPETIIKLRQAGYTVKVGQVFTAVEAIEIAPGGWIYGYADPRRADGGAVGLCVEDMAVAC
ncbi:MAG: gamma-glutamyltransferase [Proteobacteria bacterium]|nr:gamma-glutamyltransferase [Pseudomonadota bacterium]